MSKFSRIAKNKKRNYNKTKHNIPKKRTAIPNKRTKINKQTKRNQKGGNRFKNAVLAVEAMNRFKNLSITEQEDGYLFTLYKWARDETYDLSKSVIESVVEGIDSSLLTFDQALANVVKARPNVSRERGLAILFDKNLFDTYFSQSWMKITDPGKIEVIRSHHWNHLNFTDDFSLVSLSNNLTDQITHFSTSMLSRLTFSTKSQRFVSHEDFEEYCTKLKMNIPVLKNELTFTSIEGIEKGFDMYLSPFTLRKINKDDDIYYRFNSTKLLDEYIKEHYAKLGIQLDFKIIGGELKMHHLHVAHLNRNFTREQLLEIERNDPNKYLCRLMSTSIMTYITVYHHAILTHLMVSECVTSLNDRYLSETHPVRKLLRCLEKGVYKVNESLWMALFTPFVIGTTLNLSMTGLLELAKQINLKEDVNDLFKRPDPDLATIIPTLREGTFWWDTLYEYVTEFITNDFESITNDTVINEDRIEEKRVSNLQQISDWIDNLPWTLEKENVTIANLSFICTQCLYINVVHETFSNPEFYNMLDPYYGVSSTLQETNMDRLEDTINSKQEQLMIQAIGMRTDVTSQTIDKLDTYDDLGFDDKQLQIVHKFCEKLRIAEHDGTFSTPLLYPSHIETSIRW